MFGIISYVCVCAVTTAGVLDIVRDVSHATCPAGGVRNAGFLGGLVSQGGSKYGKVARYFCWAFLEFRSEIVQLVAEICWKKCDFLFCSIMPSTSRHNTPHWLRWWNHILSSFRCFWETTVDYFLMGAMLIFRTVRRGKKYGTNHLSIMYKLPRLMTTKLRLKIILIFTRSRPTLDLKKLFCNHFDLNW